MKIVFATNNQHKLQEVRQILGNSIEVLSLADIGCHEDIPETGQTLEENAMQKATYIYEHYHMDCFADDTGLEVDALGGAPGVYSARYAALTPLTAPETTPLSSPEVTPLSSPEGDTIASTAKTNEAPSGAVGGVTSGAVGGGGLSHDSEANMTRLLNELGNNNNRRARFRTVIALLQKRNVCPCGCTTIRQEHLFEGIVDGQITRHRSGAEGFGYDPIFQPEGYDKTFAELGAEIKNKISHRARATQRLADYLLSKNK